MSYFVSCNVLADLALSAKARKILSGLIVDDNQPQMLLEDIPITMALSHVSIVQQRLYASAAIRQLTYNDSGWCTNYSLKVPILGFANTFSERTVVRTRSQSNSNELSLGNRSEWGELLITQFANSNLENDLANWIIWTDDRGYLYFQPTIKALNIWLKMLFDRTYAADQDDEGLSMLSLKFLSRFELIPEILIPCP